MVLLINSVLGRGFICVRMQCQCIISAACIVRLAGSCLSENYLCTYLNEIRASMLMFYTLDCIDLEFVLLHEMICAYGIECFMLVIC